MSGQEKSEITDQAKEYLSKRVTVVVEARVHPDNVGHFKDAVRLAMFQAGIGGEEIDRGGLKFSTSTQEVAPEHVLVDSSDQVAEK
jgi:hypothetical protein